MQKLILLDLREKYIQLSRSNSVNPVFFTRIDEMMDNMDKMQVRERQIYQPGRSFDESLHSQNSLQRPSSAPNLHLRDQRSISEYLNSDRDDIKRPSTAGRLRRKTKSRHGKAKHNKKVVFPAYPIDDNAPRGGLVVFSRPPTIFGRTKEMKTPTKKQKNMQKKKKKRPRRKKLSLEEKDRMERRTITITGLVSDITTESIRSTFKCWNKTVKRLKRDNASTIKVTFATHRDFRDSMSMLKILAYSTSSGSNTQTEAASSRTLSNAGSHEIAEYRKHGYGIPLRMMLPRATGQEATDGAFQGSDLLVDGTVAKSRASMLDAGDPETLEDDFMYGLTHFRPYSPPISPIKIPKRLHQLRG
jgi:hypothetical protein